MYDEQGRLRVAVPKLTLTAIFSWIVLDIYLVIGTLIPTFSGTLAQLLVKPAAAAAAVGLVCNLIFFPESTSHKALHDMQAMLAPMKGFLNACLLNFEKPSMQFDPMVLEGAKAKAVMGYKEIESSLGFLPLDLSIGRWNAEDILSLKEPMGKVVTMYTGLIQLQIDRITAYKKRRNLDDIEAALEGGDENRKPTIGAHQLALSLDARHSIRHPEEQELLWKSLAALLASSSNIMGSCMEALDAIIESLAAVNNKRFFSRSSAQQCEDMAAEHEELLQRLIQHEETFSREASEGLLDPHEHLFNEEGKLRNDEEIPPVHGLIVGLLFEVRMLAVSHALKLMLKRIIELERGRTRTRVWFPTGIRHLFAWGFGRAPTPAISSMGDLDHQQIEKVETIVTERHKKSRRAARKDKKEAKKQTTESSKQFETLRFVAGKKRSTAGRIMLATIKWLTSDESLFGFRVVLVTVILGVPAVCMPSAGFYYKEKGLWALIMGQMGVGTYTSDFVFGLTSRIVGTVIGGIMGMVCWYIGAGSGNGEPYGMAAIFGIAIVFLMWLRLFTGPQYMQGAMLMAATTFLVASYSWVDTYVLSFHCLVDTLLIYRLGTSPRMEILALATTYSGAVYCSS